MLAPRFIRIPGCAALVAGALAGASAAAEPIPLPSADFALTAKLARGGQMELAHSQGRMRVEMSHPNAPGTMVGLIDLKARRMIMMMPNLPKMAVEVELPPDAVMGAQTGTGQRVGRSEVVGEPCDLWQVDPPPGRRIGPTIACITADGIALRTEAEIRGTKQQLYVVESLKRGPQDPQQFQLPPGVKVMKMPKGKLGGIPVLPGLSPEAGDR